MTLRALHLNRSARLAASALALASALVFLTAACATSQPEVLPTPVPPTPTPTPTRTVTPTPTPTITPTPTNTPTSTPPPIATVTGTVLPRATPTPISPEVRTLTPTATPEPTVEQPEPADTPPPEAIEAFQEEGVLMVRNGAGDEFAVLAATGLPDMWDPNTGRASEDGFGVAAETFRTFALSPDAQWIAWDTEGAVHDLLGVVHVPSRRAFVLDFLFEGSVNTFAWSPQSDYLAAGLDTPALPTIEIYLIGDPPSQLIQPRLIDRFGPGNEESTIDPLWRDDYVLVFIVRSELDGSLTAWEIDVIIGDIRREDPTR